MIRRVENFLARHTETFLVGVLGLLIFGGLNYLMLHMNYDMWSSLKYGAYSAFHRGWELSGFDNTTYIAVSTWRPLYVMMRHPLIMYFVWPMYWLHGVLETELRMNCSIHIVAAVWTIVSTISWLLLYRIMRKIIVLPIGVSLLVCLFYYSFSHVMLATFAPDHMILSMTLFLLALYLSAKAVKEGKRMSAWKAMLLCFFATGVSTTNCAKIWLIDIMGTMGKGAMSTWEWWKPFLVRSMLYLLPVAAVGGLYYYETETIFAEEEAYSKKMDTRLKETNRKKYDDISRCSKETKAEMESKQISDSKLFQWTDFSLPIMPSIIENVFGEGLQLHDEYTLRDSHRANHRPDIVAYSHWYNYVVEVLVVVLLIVGVWYGRKERLMWMALAVMGFDTVIHIGFRFALNDVYIMTAHWAFIIPIAVGYLYKGVKNDRVKRSILLAVVALLTLWLWHHNLSLTCDFIVNAIKD